jgi:PBP1b-binding outer membrane lipoprotein LpoB
MKVKFLFAFLVITALVLAGCAPAVTPEPIDEPVEEPAQPEEPEEVE